LTTNRSPLVKTVCTTAAEAVWALATQRPLDATLDHSRMGLPPYDTTWASLRSPQPEVFAVRRRTHYRLAPSSIKPTRYG
jgi:hypothetical protein